MRRVAALVLLAASGACDVLLGPEDDVRFHIEGSVTAATSGAPLTAAVVELLEQQSDSLAVVAATAVDSAGHYALNHETDGCAPVLFTLRASSPGRVPLSYTWTGDASTHVRCSDDLQQIDFALELP